MINEHLGWHGQTCLSVLYPFLKDEYMFQQIRIVGLGGQGIVLLGQIIGQAGIYDKRYVAQSSAYGPETRGSLCRAEVIIADSPIDYPYAVRSDILVAMTQKGYENFANSVEKLNGSIFYDTKLVKVLPHVGASASGGHCPNTKYFPVPATESAIKHFGSPTTANILMLGAVVEATNIISKKSTLKAIKEIIAPKAVSTNLEAFNLGVDLGAKVSLLNNISQKN
ncbi:MAG TPA: 2-oxoacid:acceptor oxidoreductase family protein [Candidatus Brocadiia bacterium]|nr:2-oxoacid:acceptor oxidoreductase family protein [Planctomycetota bacterium]MDO8093621.1 2-oxoacid:acceptor oxidoreductase family protein [Candidatus Brocadiales bacterium]